MSADPRYPIYVVSKGRYYSRLTCKALDAMRVSYFVVVESSEYRHYARFIPAERLLVLPVRYLLDYDTFDDLGDTKSKGPGPARNFCWDHSISNGYAKHWVMDDNLDAFHRLNRNRKLESDHPAVISAQEDFVDRYDNLAISGPNYYSFVKTVDKVPAYTLNTRIYSCLLIRNDIPFRWRGRYNEDTDLCLRVMKSGWATLQFNAFLCGKVTTQRMSGGNNAAFYKEEGTLPKSRMLEQMHPDVAKVVWRFNRWHHTVDYSSFKNNPIVRKVGLKLRKGSNNYGMRLVPFFRQVRVRKVRRPYYPGLDSI